MPNQDQYYTDLDIQLQALATGDWVAFSQLLGSECMLRAKIIMLRNGGSTYQQIANRLDTTKEIVRYWVEKQPGARKQST